MAAVRYTSALSCWCGAYGDQPLETANVKMMGAVLNRVNLQRDGYYHSNYYRCEYSQYHTAAS
jgi:hypothetical protein